MFVLGFVGVKMMLTHHYHIDSTISLLVIAALLGGGVLASTFVKPEEAPDALTEGEPKATVPESDEAAEGAEAASQDKRS